MRLFSQAIRVKGMNCGLQGVLSGTVCSCLWEEYLTVKVFYKKRYKDWGTYRWGECGEVRLFIKQRQQNAF